MSAFPPCPPQLKVVQHYLKLASDYQPRNSTISYWARLYSLQTALKIDGKSPEAKALLTALIDWLEKYKNEHPNDESITSDIAGQAVIENEGHKLFIKADSDDRSAKFDKNVVKTFYTAGILFDVCEVFGELTEEITSQRKYAKWKATYIHNCLKKGEMPIPGPAGGIEDEGFEREEQFEHPSLPHESSDFSLPAMPPFSEGAEALDPSHPHIPVNEPVSSEVKPYSSGLGEVNLTPELYAKAQKYCKFATSSLDYEDSKTAIGYLEKALSILTAGRES